MYRKVKYSALTQPVSNRAQIQTQAMCLYFTAFAVVEHWHNPFIHQMFTEYILYSR